MAIFLGIFSKNLSFGIQLAIERKELNRVVLFHKVKEGTSVKYMGLCCLKFSSIMLAHYIFNRVISFECSDLKIPALDSRISEPSCVILCNTETAGRNVQFNSSSILFLDRSFKCTK